MENCETEHNSEQHASSYNTQNDCRFDNIRRVMGQDYLGKLDVVRVRGTCCS